jgi:hyaluronan synthase
MAANHGEQRDALGSVNRGAPPRAPVELVLPAAPVPDHLRDHHRTLRVLQPVHIPTRETHHGALNDTYDVPSVRYSRRATITTFITCTLIAASVAWRLRNGVAHLPVYLFGIAPILGMHIFAWVLSCFDKPHTVTPAQQAALDRLYVSVSIPCKNEDPGLLDRCLWSLVNQTRPPQRIDMVDDGSDKVDYSELRRHWNRIHGNCLVTWTRKPRNDGKRRAHCTTVSQDNDGEIFVTVDSDTTIALNGIEEILKPFADPAVMSVAGIELGMNAGKNFLTVIQNAFQQSSQAIIGAAWAVTGNMFTNRGPFAAYRGTMLREILPVYYGETFYGRRVILGDDSLLALAGSMRGKSVQQLSAFGLTMWPDNLWWHLRQRTRWARGRTIRNFWRFKYYRIGSYIFWFTFINTYAFLEVTCIFVRAMLHFHHALPYLAHIVLALILFSWIAQLRCLCFRRSDEGFLDRMMPIVLRPFASIWAAFVLNRGVRMVGTLTCLKQQWTTRHDVEDTLEGSTQ